MHFGLWLLQTLFWGRRIARTQLQGDPIFVIGHWRSGTTLLHELLVLDERHTYSNTFDCFCPNHFLLTAPVFRPLVRGLLPKQRPMDNMAAGWDCPQEDEFALCNMGLRSPYLTIAFPNHPPQNQEFFELAEVSPRQRARWQRGLMWFLKCLTVRTPRRIVLKSPPHTFRIKVLLEMFPKARFIHIVRNPLVIFPSTINLWKRLYRNDGLQVPTYEGLDEHVFETFTRMYEVFERDRGLIPAGQFCEVRYEDLVAQPIQQMQRVYERIESGRVRKGASANGGLFRQEGRLQDQSLSASTRVGRGNRPPLGELLPALRLFRGMMLVQNNFRAGVIAGPGSRDGCTTTTFSRVKAALTAASEQD